MVKEKLEGIQVARGIAALLVLVFHAAGRVQTVAAEETQGFLHLLRGGDAGVDLFFVISGFVITYAHAKDIGRPEELRLYAFRRFMRIYPLFWLLCAMVIPLYFAVPSAGDGWQREVDNILGTLLLVPVAPKPIIGVAWTLVLEVIFYAMFSLMIFGGRIGQIIFALWIVVAAASPLYGSTGVYALNIFLSDHFLGFLLGMGVAVSYRSLSQRQGALSLAFGSMLFLMACAYQSWTNPPLGVRPTSIELLVDVGSAFIILGVAAMRVQLSGLVGRAVLFLGEATYSIYLFHWLAGWFAVKAIASMGLAGKLHALPLLVGISGLMLVAGIAAYLVAERPIQSATRLFARALFVPAPARAAPAI